MEARSELGRRGEDLAADLYLGLGFDVLERNFRCPQGELDLVCRKGDQLVFCEVKARRTARWGAPSEAVDERKQARLRRLASEWLRTNRPGACAVRFDVVSVIVDHSGESVEHIVDAF